MKISKAFEKVDNFGIFQKVALVALGCSGAFHGMQTSSTNFISGQPERWCSIERLQNFSYEQQKFIAIPLDSEGEYDSCNAFNLNWTNFSDEQLLSWNRTHYEETEVRPCDEFVYSKEVFLETALSKWGLVCSNSLLSEFISTLYVTGLFIGSISSGRISDSFGRRIGVTSFAALLILTLFTAAFVNNAIAFLVLRFLIGVCTRGANISASVLMMEFSGPKEREMAGVLSPGLFAVGVMLCSGCAYALRDFQLLHIVMGSLAACLLLIMAVVPESPRWLLVNGKVEKAEKVMKWIGEVNNSPLADDFTLKKKAAESKSNKTQASYIDLYKYPVLRKHILIMHFLWVAINFSHMAMTLNLGALTGNPYLNVFISGATEVPASIAVMYTMRHLGRKRTFLIFGSVFVICNAIAIPFELLQDLRIGASVATILARAAAGGLLSNLRVLTVELFPTSARQRVLGGMTGLAAGVGISGSYIGGSLRGVWRPLPNIIFGSLGFGAVLLATLLPETLGKGLPESIEDAIATVNKRIRTVTMDTVSSISSAVEKNDEKLGKKGDLEFGVVVPVVVEEEPTDDDSLNDEVLIAHF